MTRVESTGDELDELEDAIAVANIPTLLMVLLQLTGERRWLEPPYRPARPRGMEDNDTGGLAPSVQEEVRAEARLAIVEWRRGRPVAIDRPSNDLLVEMLSWAMGERVPDEYGPMIAAELGVDGAVGYLDAVAPVDVPPGFNVLVIGAGISGLCAAANLHRAGIPFQIVEKQDTVGGVWNENRYPGAGVDTPSHLYSFSFLPHDWKQYFALRDEIHEYLERAADEFDVRQFIRFGTEARSVEYDADGRHWVAELLVPDGRVETVRANIVISAAGVFNPPRMPDIPGLGDFRGPVFHSAQWPAGVDVRDRRVALIGNGASAMQIGPEIQDEARSLTVFQRSAHWIAPFERFRQPVATSLRLLLREVPLYRAWYRIRLGWTYNDRAFASLHKDPEWPFPDRSLNRANEAQRVFFTEYIESELSDRPDMIPKVVPTYPPFGKRMLLDNGWYRMLRNERVELVTDRISLVTEQAIEVETGERHEVDVIVVATGFDVTKYLSSYTLRGRHGQTLREAWNDDDARAYLGLAVPGFPNFFCMYGPNIQPGHGGSIIVLMEMQMRYIMSALRQMIEGGIDVVEVRKDVHDRYNDLLDAAHEGMVWTHPGMSTYVRNARGRVVVNLPYRTVDLFGWTCEADLSDFVTEP